MAGLTTNWFLLFSRICSQGLWRLWGPVWGGDEEVVVYDNAQLRRSNDPSWGGWGLRPNVSLGTQGPEHSLDSKR